MKIESAKIVNFRSVAAFDLTFSYGCQVLVGINESGKSNILRALQLLDPAVAPTPSDLRIERRDESPVDSGYVQFSFQLNEAEIEKIFAALSASFNTESLKEPVLVQKGRTFTLKEFCQLRCKGLHKIDIATGERRTQYWTLPVDSYQIIQGWKKSKISNDLTLVNMRQKEVVLKDSQIFQSEIFQTLGDLVTEPVTPEDLNGAIGKLVVAHIKAQLPKCVYWRYSDQYLLPSSLNIDEFVQNPDSCVPLKVCLSLQDLAARKFRAR